MPFRFNKEINITGIFMISLLSKLNDKYKKILYAEKGHFYPSEEKGRGIDPQDPPP